MTGSADPTLGSGLLVVPGLESWAFSAEGAAIHRDLGVAVIADVHLGYEWARASGGDMVPEHSLAETIGKLERLARRIPIRRLIVAGDLVETAGPCPRTSRDVTRFGAWLKDRGIELGWVKGNHDPPRRPSLPARIELDGWSISHGDRPIPIGPAVFGHHHPALFAEGLRAPCFLVGPQTIALPAFSQNAAGLDIRGRLPRPLAREPLRCLATLGGEILDFGPIDPLRRAARPS